MKFSSFVLLGLLALASVSARANDVNNNVALSGGTSFFGALHTDGADFTDVFTFTVAGGYTVNGGVATFGSGTSNIDFTSADINGIPLVLSPTGVFESALTGGSLNVTGPIILTVKGKSGAAGNQFASYSGTLNAVPVPEPTTCVLALSALGAGLMIRRKR